MIREIILYQTEDGKRFENRSDAESHERVLTGHLEKLLPLVDYIAGKLIERGISSFSRVNNIIYIMCNVPLSDGSYLTERIDQFQAWENGFYFSSGNLVNYDLKGNIYKRNGKEFREPERDEWFDKADEALSILEKDYRRIFSLHWIKLASYIRSIGLHESCRSLMKFEGKSSVEIRRCVMETVCRPCLNYIKTENERSTDTDYSLDDMFTDL